VTVVVIAGFPDMVVLVWIFDFSLAGIRLTRPKTLEDRAETPMVAAPIQQPVPKHSIAVLPFSDMSAERGQAYLGDVAEEILNALVHLQFSSHQYALVNRPTASLKRAMSRPLVLDIHICHVTGMK
jgi:hypothetical protein